MHVSMRVCACDDNSALTTREVACPTVLQQVCKYSGLGAEPSALVTLSPMCALRFVCVCVFETKPNPNPNPHPNPNRNTDVGMVMVHFLPRAQQQQPRSSLLQVWRRKMRWQNVLISMLDMVSVCSFLVGVRYAGSGIASVISVSRAVVDQWIDSFVVFLIVVAVVVVVVVCDRISPLSRRRWS